MSNAFDCARGVRRLAEAQSVAELEHAWTTTQAEFQKKWKPATHKVIVLVHDNHGGITDDDVTDVLGQINAIEKHQPVDVIIHTHGGYASSTLQIASVLVKRPKTTSLVPFFAKSGGTIIALSTSRIRLGNGAALGPTDLQYAGMPARDLIQIASELGQDAPPDWRAAAIDAKRALRDEAKKICSVVNESHKGFLGWRGCDLANKLTSGHLHHGEAITFGMARKMHMNVARNIPKSVYGLVSIRLEQLRRLRELEAQVNLVQRQGP